MKLSTVTLFYLLCFLGLLTFFGCGSDTEDTEKASGLIAERPEPEKTDDIYIPDDWYKTEDPILRNDYFLAILIEQFGDIPEVHTIARYQRKKLQGRSVTIDEYNAYLEARAHLWPDRETPRKLGELEEIEDPEVFAKLYREELVEQFGDIPEVDIVVEAEKKFMTDEGLTIDDYLTYLNARFHLYQDNGTLRAIQRALELKQNLPKGKVNVLDDDDDE